MGLKRLARTWDALARRDPLWAILTWPDKRGGRWDPDDFLATGRAEVDAVLARARALHPRLGRSRALDFGCGAGRLTQALCAHFDAVDGVDIAAGMLEHARRLDRGGATWHLHTAADLSLFPDGRFDFVYTSITLQHMPPALMRRYLREFPRVLAPGGLLCCQLPERLHRRPSRTPLRRAAGALGARALRRLRAAIAREPLMDMHGLPRDEVTALLERHGCRLLAVDPSSMSGPDWLGWLYFAVRPHDGER